MTGSPPKPDVPKGPATITGYGTAAAAFVAMFLAYVFPDGDEQTLGVIAAGAVGLASLLWTNYGRQKQAVAQIEAAGAVEQIVASKSRSGVFQPQLRDAYAALEKVREDEAFPAASEGIDPEYEGRDGTLETRLKFEQREGCS